MLDIEKLLREGKTLDEIGDLVSAELNAAQDKIDKENEKKAAAAKEKEALNSARDAAITALINYITLVSPKTAKEVNLTKALNDGLDSLVEGLNFIDNFTIKYNGQNFSIFDL